LVGRRIAVVYRVLAAGNVRLRVAILAISTMSPSLGAVCCPERNEIFGSAPAGSLASQRRRDEA
jgi:hypothetical protein